MGKCTCTHEIDQDITVYSNRRISIENKSFWNFDGNIDTKGLHALHSESFTTLAQDVDFGSKSKANIKIRVGQNRKLHSNKIWVSASYDYKLVKDYKSFKCQIRSSLYLYKSTGASECVVQSVQLHTHFLTHSYEKDQSLKIQNYLLFCTPIFYLVPTPGLLL